MTPTPISPGGERSARVFFALTSALVTFGLVLQLVLVLTRDPDADPFMNAQVHGYAEG